MWSFLVVNRGMGVWDECLCRRGPGVLPLSWCHVPLWCSVSTHVDPPFILQEVHLKLILKKSFPEVVPPLVTSITESYCFVQNSSETDLAF